MVETTPGTVVQAGQKVDVAAKLHELLDALRSDATEFVVLHAVPLRGTLHLIGYVPDRPGSRFLARAVVLHCGRGMRPITEGRRLRLWRDGAGVYLEHCIP